MGTSATQMAVARPVRILLADGDKISLTHIQSLLLRSGYDVVVAHDGEGALRCLQSDDPPTIAVMDWAMPETGGAEICRQLRNSERRQDVYLILLARWGQHTDRLEALESGADECIFKPVDVRELRIRLQIGAQIILERALRKSEARFRSAFECSGIGMAVVSLTGEFLQTNPALCNFLGDHNLLGSSFLTIGHSEDTPSLRELLDLSLAGKLPEGEFQRRFCTKNGGISWAALTLAPVYDTDQKAACFVVQLSDISQRKKAEEALRQSEAFQRAIVDNITDLIAVIGKNNEFIYASPSHQTCLGYSPEELHGTSAYRLIHPDDLESVKKSIHELLRGEQIGLVFFRVQHRNGNWRYFEGHPGVLRNASGEITGIVAVARVVDDRLQAEQKLQAAHAETELLLHSIPSILIGLDPNGRITRWNPMAIQVFGLGDDEVIGKPLHDCGIQWVRSDIENEIERWLANDTVYHAEMLAYESEGKVRFLDLQIRRIPSADSGRVSYILAGVDITDRKGLEEQLRQAQKLEAIGQLAAGIAHEINTPTQYVGDNTRFLKESWDSVAEFLGICQRLRQQASPGAIPEDLLATFDQFAVRCDLDYLMQEIPQALAQSLEGVDRVAKIVRAMKEFSHPGSEEKKGVDLNRAVETTVTVARNEWKYIADVVTSFDPTLPFVPCLAGEMNQVFLNLIINAAHAIAEASAMQPQDPRKDKITITTRRTDRWAEISISDTGTGIPEKIRPRIFEPFFTTKAMGQGTGQGLALAHSVVVNRHQGKLWFETEVGQGTTFFIRLPLELQPSLP